MDLTDFAFPLRGEVGEQFWETRPVAVFVAPQTEAAGDVLERGPAEHRQAIVDAVGTKLVKLRAVAAVVHRADQDPISLTFERLQLLDMEQESTVAFEQHDLTLAALTARRRNAKRIGQAVADRAEFTDGRVALRRPAAHLDIEISLMAAAADDVPILWHDASIASIASRGSSSPGAISNGIASAGSVAMRCSSSFERIAAAVGLSTPSFWSRPARSASTPTSASALT